MQVHVTEPAIQNLLYYPHKVEDHFSCLCNLLVFESANFYPFRTGGTSDPLSMAGAAPSPPHSPSSSGVIFRSVLPTLSAVLPLRTSSSLSLDLLYLLSQIRANANATIRVPARTSQPHIGSETSVMRVRAESKGA